MRVSNNIALTKEQTQMLRTEVDVANAIACSSGMCFGISVLWAADQLSGSNSFYTFCNLLQRECMDGYAALSLDERQNIESTMQKIIAAHACISKIKSFLGLEFLINNDKFIAEKLNPEMIIEANNWNEMFNLNLPTSAELTSQERIAKKILQGDFTLFRTDIGVCSFFGGEWRHFIVCQDGLAIFPRRGGLFGESDYSISDLLFFACTKKIEQILSGTTEACAIIGIGSIIIPEGTTLRNENDVENLSSHAHAVAMAKTKSGVYSFFDCNKESLERDTNLYALAHQHLKPLFVETSTEKTITYRVRAMGSAYTH